MMKAFQIWRRCGGEVRLCEKSGNIIFWDLVFLNLWSDQESHASNCDRQILSIMDNSAELSSYPVLGASVGGRLVF